MKFFRKSDIKIIAVLLIIGALWIVYYHLPAADEFLCAEISCDSQVVASVPLDGEKITYVVPGHENVVLTIGEGEVAFVESDCPDKICIKTGKLTSSGQSAACLPNKVIVRVVPDRDILDPVIDNEKDKDKEKDKEPKEEYNYKTRRRNVRFDDIAG